MDKLKLIKKEIEKIVANSFVKPDPSHSKNTLEWLLKLKPTAGEELQIAALAHDIERGKREHNKNFGAEQIKGYGSHKAEHAKRSSELISELLNKYDFDKVFIERVKYLVLNHEIGGDNDANLLMDADSLSFFDTNLEDYFEKNDTEVVIFKIKYMFDRMTHKSKDLAKKFKYKNQELNDLFRKSISG